MSLEHGPTPNPLKLDNFMDELSRTTGIDRGGLSIFEEELSSLEVGQVCSGTHNGHKINVRRSVHGFENV